MGIGYPLVCVCGDKYLTYKIGVEKSQKKCKITGKVFYLQARVEGLKTLALVQKKMNIKITCKDK